MSERIQQMIGRLRSADTKLCSDAANEIERLQEQIVRDEEHYQAAMAMNEKHRRLWVETSQELSALKLTLAAAGDRTAVPHDQREPESIVSPGNEPEIEDLIEAVAAWPTSQEGHPKDVPDLIDDWIRLARKLRTRDRRFAMQLDTVSDPVSPDKGEGWRERIYEFVDIVNAGERLSSRMNGKFVLDRDKVWAFLSSPPISSRAEDS